MSWNPNANSWDPRQQQYPHQQYPQQSNPYAQPQGYGQPVPQQQYPGMMPPGGGAPMYGGGGGGMPQYHGGQHMPQHPTGYGRQPDPAYQRDYHSGYQQPPPRGGPPPRDAPRGGGYVFDPNAYGQRDAYQPPRYGYEDGGYRGTPAEQYQDQGFDDNWNDGTPIEAMAAMRIDKQQQAESQTPAAAPVTAPAKKRKRKRGKKKNKTEAEEQPAEPVTRQPAPVIRLANTTPSAKPPKQEPSPPIVEEKQVAPEQPQTVEPEEKIESVEAEPPGRKKKKKNKRQKVTWSRHDEREHINLVLIGHVDAGKSTLSGQILLQLGKIDARTIAKYEREAKEHNRESWWIAYIMDEDEEERAKGKTVECGRAHFDTDTKRYTILDAPGHKNYVPNMISGAAQADVALLVISARSGEFEAGFERGGQTQEHAQLAFTLGITRLVVVVNKMDTCEYSQQRFDDIVDRTTNFLRECGYKDKYMDFLPLSGQTGANVLTAFESGVCSWWDGKTLMQTLDSLKKIKRLTSNPLRITVLDRYKGDKGLTVIGKVEAGVVSIGTPIVCMPSGVSSVVGTLCIDEQPVESAGAGENVLVSFTSSGNMNDSRVHGGSILSAHSPDAVPVSRRFKSEIYLIDLPEAGIMAVGFRAMFHCHNIATECELSAIPHLINRKLGKVSRRPPPFLKLKNTAVAEITILSGGIAVEPFDICPPLGRFTLRDQGKTVVIGVIKEILE